MRVFHPNRVCEALDNAEMMRFPRGPISACRQGCGGCLQCSIVGYIEPPFRAEGRDLAILEVSTTPREEISNFLFRGLIAKCQNFYPICGNTTVTPDNDPGSRFWIPAPAPDAYPGLAGMTRERPVGGLPGVSDSFFQLDTIFGNCSVLREPPIFQPVFQTHSDSRSKKSWARQELL